MTRLIVVDVVIGRRRRGHGQRGSYVEGVSGDGTSIRVAVDFRVGEQGFVALLVNCGNGDIEAVTRVEAQCIRTERSLALVGQPYPLSVEVLVDGTGGDHEVIDTVVVGIETDAHSLNAVPGGVEVLRRVGSARQARGDRSHHLGNRGRVVRGDVRHLVVRRVLVGCLETGVFAENLESASAEDKGAARHNCCRPARASTRAFP